jgi:hypothetical protein
MKKFTLSAALLLFSVQAQAVPEVEIAILDLTGGLPTETYSDAGSGSLAVTTADSVILSTYWGTASGQIAASNNVDPSQPFAELINASINLDAIEPLGTNVGVIIQASGFENFTGLGEAFTIINASTVDATAFDAAVFVDAIEILDVDNVSTTDTFSALVDVTVGGPFSITHVFDLTTLAVGGDLGFDISTAVAPKAVPAPLPLALMGLGFLGMLGARKVIT